MSLVTIISGGSVFSPAPLGTRDLTIAGGRIIEIAAKSSYAGSAGVDEYDASGRYVVPAFVDAHLHVLGAGTAGEAPTPPIQPEAIFQSGAGTVVSCLGTDDVSLSLSQLLVQARRIETKGVNTYTYTGGFSLPPPTLFGTIRHDIALIDRMVGVKSTVGEPLGGRQSVQEIVRLCGEVSLGGRLGGKHAVAHLHIGDDPSAFAILGEILTTHAVEADLIVATHANRSGPVLDAAISYAREGGFIDLTAMQSRRLDRPHAVSPSDAIRRIIRQHVDLTHVSLSSDAGGPRVTLTTSGNRYWQTQPVVLLDEWRHIVRSEALDLEAALKLVTSNPADRLGLSREGRLAAGTDADVLVLSQDLVPVQLWTGGHPRFQSIPGGSLAEAPEHISHGPTPTSSSSAEVRDPDSRHE